MPQKIIKNPNCKKCKFRSSKPTVNGCDYCYLTGHLRNCPVENCTKFQPGKRISRVTAISLSDDTL